jgi:Fic family protein
MDSNLNQVIERIDKLMLEVDSYRPLKPEQEQRLLQKIRLDWNFHSSKIEGNSLTYGETKALLFWGITAQGKPLRDHLEIKGHNEAVEYIMDILKGKERPITESFIREMHKVIIPEPYELDAKTPSGMLIKRKITPGEYKKMPNHVETYTGEIFYFASPEDTPAKMMDLMNWFKIELEEKKHHPIFIASMFHFYFVRIHPFDDGNGRMSRLLMNLILMQFGFPPVIIQTVKREEYLNSLQYADAEEYDKFIIFIGERLVESLELWLKAVKGESIDDYDDMDKMVALLKKKIEWSGMDEDVYIEKSTEIINHLFTSYISTLFEKFLFSFSKLNNFFVNSNLTFWFNNSGHSIKHEELTSNFIEGMRNSTIDSFGVEYNLSKLSNYDEDLKIHISINFEFFQYYYILNYYSNQLFRIKKRYHQELSEIEIKQIVADIFNSAFNVLNKKIDELNKKLEIK